tara:strand:+ start:7647 stop:7922 length:276 start_codon:yes stop_codon:yes gene_type:complete
MNNPHQVAMGQYGAEKIVSSDGTVTAGSGRVFAAITAITAGVDLEAGTAVESDKYAYPSTIPQGATIFGRFTAINLGGSGTDQEVLAYYDK